MAGNTVFSMANKDNTMNPKKLSVGMVVVVTNDDDAQAYTITRIDGFNIHLMYPLKNGQMASGGIIDASFIKGILLT